MMKKIFLILTSILYLVTSCSDKKPESIFSQVSNYCELGGNSEYCNLGLHQKTLEEIKAVYGNPIDSFSGFRLPLDTCGFENGAYTYKTLISLFLNIKYIEGKKTPLIYSYTWCLGKDSCLNEDIWLRIYFIEDDLRRYRAIYGEKAREKFFYFE